MSLNQPNQNGAERREDSKREQQQRQGELDQFRRIAISTSRSSHRVELQENNPIKVVRTLFPPPPRSFRYRPTAIVSYWNRELVLHFSDPVFRGSDARALAELGN